MNETQRRIKAYKEALPGLRERVIAVALLLAMSAAMMTSASFAWLTISRRPELTGVSTTVAANGNLEIALAGPEGNKPAESAVGDSSAATGQKVTLSNITWGNLINLSDASYGLENLILRPAQLNTASLLDSPLYGAVYGQDGRITQLSSNFGYATWNVPDGDKPGYFGVSDSYGVRAISSTTIEAVGAAAAYYNMVTTAKNKNLGAANMYVALGSNDRYMPSLATMMGLYMTARMNPSHETLSNPSLDIADIQNLRDMYVAFLECFDAEADAMAALVNVQLFLKHGDGNYTPYTATDIYATTSAKLKADGLQITNLDQFLRDRNTVATDLEKLKEICSSGTTLTWKDSGLSNIVNNLVNVGACTIGADNTPISSIGASNAAGYLNGTQEARITNGILYRFEERTGGYIQVEELSISATVSRTVMGLPVTVPATVKANISTTAPRDYNLFTNDRIYTEDQNDGNYAGGIPVAEDTYGLAIDLWVRTNADSSYLTLEGNVLTETETVRATGSDANGNTVQLYTVTLTSQGEDGGSTSFSVDLYQIKTEETAEDGTVTEIITWYKADNHAVMTPEEMGEEEPIPKMEEVVHVIGFEGENRVWDDSMLSTDATTQGSGSCYVYYADSPEDQARSLRLLEAFNVAFVDQEGKLLATAVMDTEHYYAVSGRVIVPLVLSSTDSISLGEDSQGNTTYAITALEQNVPTWITAIVYLDGTKLTNQEVLAAADIQGQLNIQFGSSASLSAIKNETLQNAERKVTATIDNYEFNYDTATGPMITNVTVHVDGEQPNTMTAFFMRSVNSTQGSREGTMTFTQNGSGDWVASYPFTSPGTYVLRTIQLDGVDYDLPNTEASPIPTVVVKGFTIESLGCQQAIANHVSVMTAASSSTVNLSLKFVADDVEKMPQTVTGRYLREDGSAVNVEFTYNPTTQIWSGTATFLTSGEYTLQYLVLDGKYTELDPGFWQTANVSLGMRVVVYTTSPHRFKYAPSTMAENEKHLGMQVKILDNGGNELPGLTDVKLIYGMNGSSINAMDANLTWNGSYYVGELLTEGPGIWKFSAVTVGSNTLTNATSKPEFTVLSPEPPRYYGHRTPTYQFVPNNDATMNVQITHSSAAQVQAYIVRADGTDGVWVDVHGEPASGTTEDGTPYNTFTFLVPKNLDNNQDGHWVLSQLRLWDVFDASGKQYTQEEPMIFDVSDTNNVTKVVAKIYVTFAEDRSQNFGKDASGKVTGAFMQSHTISGLNVDIKDFEGQSIPGVKDVKLTFAYKTGTSQTNGGYKMTGSDGSDILSNATQGATIVVALDSNSGTTYAQTKGATILYAGDYSTTLTFAVSRSGQPDQVKTYSGDDLPGNAPVLAVFSKTPSVTVADVTPDGKYGIDTSGEIKDTATSTSRTEQTTDNCGNVESTTYYTHTWHTNAAHKAAYLDNGQTTTSWISADKLTATVYFRCVHADDATYSGGADTTSSSASDERLHAYSTNGALTSPTVTLNLSGISDFTSATLSFSDNTHIYTKATVTQVDWILAYLNRTLETTDAALYSWTAEGNCTRYIGYTWNKESRSSDAPTEAGKKTPAGKITANTLTVVYSDGNTYNFTIPTVTINNPN